MSMAIRACRDCRHVRAATDGATCMHEQVGKRLVDYFSGEEIIAQPSVQLARTIGACGNDAKLWEPKP